MSKAAGPALLSPAAGSLSPLLPLPLLLWRCWCLLALLWVPFASRPSLHLLMRLFCPLLAVERWNVLPIASLPPSLPVRLCAPLCPLVAALAPSARLRPCPFRRAPVARLGCPLGLSGAPLHA